uniref:Uncharacterized protein n=1 Tax=Arundo donax TaxID=35708 RepID=A0A0A9ASP9_ARUDO
MANLFGEEGTRGFLAFPSNIHHCLILVRRTKPLKEIP